MKNKNIFQFFLPAVFLCFFIFYFFKFSQPSVFALTDSDKDGLSDQTEISLKLDPNQYDTDGGGTGDGAEILLDKTNPLNPADDIKKDRDRDGLPDSDELVLGTSITSKDTDTDGLSDYEEWKFQSLGYIKDSDNDGLNDAKEKIYHTDPLHWDSDKDGVSDGAEILIDGTDALDQNSLILQDSDKDGLTDAEEIIFGTDKNNADTDGDGYDDAEEIGKGYDPNGSGILDYQKILTGKGDARLEGLTRETVSIEKISLLTLYNSDENSLSESQKIILLLEGQAPALTEAELFIYSNQTEEEVFKGSANADLNSQWIKKIDQALGQGDYIAYIAILTSQGRILIKSNPKAFIIEKKEEVEIKPTEPEKRVGFIEPEGSPAESSKPESIMPEDQEVKTNNPNLKLMIGLPILLIIMAVGGFVLFKLSKEHDKNEDEVEIPLSASSSAESVATALPSSAPTTNPAPTEIQPQPKQLKDIAGQTFSNKNFAPSNLPGVSIPTEITSNTQDTRSKLQSLAKRIK